MLRQMNRWIAYPLVWLVAMLIPMLWTPVANLFGPAAAVNQFRIDSFDGTYLAIPADGRLTLEVTERITATFPKPRTNRGIERRLDGSYGETRIGLDDFRVTDEDGRPIQFKRINGSDGDVTLRIGDPRQYVSGTVIYVIRYTIGNAMVQADDRQEIYLDINGTGWLQPFGKVTATVDVSRLSDRLLGEQACYQGQAGSNQPCWIEQRSDRIHAAATGLTARETMTIAIGFQPGTVVTTVPALRRAGFGWPGMAVMPAFGALCLAFALGMRLLRRRVTAPADVPTRFEPPQDIPPIAAADFLGRPETGAAAQLADLVIRGLATISSGGEPVATAAQDRGRLGRRPATELRSHLVVQLNRPSEITGGTLRAICTGLFGEGKPVSLDRVRRGDVTDATRRRRDLLALLGVRGEVLVPGPMLALGMIALVAWGWAQLLLGIPGLAWPFLGLGVSGVLLLVAAVHYYPTVGRLTKAGRQLRDDLAGLHRFVTMAEAGRISWLQNAVDAPRISGADDSGTLVKLYEPLLPYAIVFGVERTWQHLLGGLHEPSPPDSQEVTVTHAITSWVSLAGESPLPRLYDDQDGSTSSWWGSRPAWGEGWIASGRRSLAEAWDERRTARDDDRGGSSWSSGGSSSSWSGSSSSGSSGGGSAGGGMGGGGGGGW